MSPFDKQFNAITGLNGSGKSNVLDGICFVLGITNLSKVRAGNLSELVYKQGQAGITKASVTVVFNNSDKNSGRSPVGFESCDKITVCRQIVIGGRNRYFLNGKAAQLQEIYNLFHSVQLNINNPHFLIMQGSITKVINMKPQEILGMIEEAAGTSMYEAKKSLSLRTLEKKQLKVDEIDRIIKEEIEPQLAKLKEEKKAFLEWSNLVKEAEELELFVLRWEYRTLASKLEGGGGEYDKTEAEFKQWTETYRSLKQSVSKAEEKAKSDIKLLEKQRASQEEAEKTLESEIQITQRKLAEAKTILKEKSATLKGNTGRQLKSKSAEEKLEKDIGERAKETNELEGKSKLAKKNLIDCENKLELETQLVNDLNSGGLGAGTSGQSLQVELTTKKSDLDKVFSEITSVGIHLRGLEKQLTSIRSSSTAGGGRASMLSGEYDRLAKEREDQIDKKNELEKKLRGINFNPMRFQELIEKTRTNERKIESLTEQKNALNSILSQRLSIEIPSVDPQKIKGMVAKLISIKPEYGEKYLKALEILAGGKLFNVVLDSERTCREILESGKLKKRITFLPLDKIQSKKISQTQICEAVSIANKIPGSEAVPAIETVAFLDEVAPAIQYVFGTSFVCDSSELAKRVTFNNNLPDNLKHKTVTSEGDVYDPKGSLTGGDDSNRSSRLLGNVYELQKIVYEWMDLQRETELLQGEKQRMLTFKESFEKTSKEISQIAGSINVIDAKMKSTNQSQQAEEIESCEKSIKLANERLKSLESQKNALSLQVENLTKEIADISRNKTERIRIASATVAKLRKEKQSLSNQIKECEKALEIAKIAQKSAEEELKSFREDMSNQSAVSSALESEISVLEEKVHALKDTIEQLQGKLKEQKIFKNSFDKSIADIAEAIRVEKGKLDDAEINVKKFESLMDQLGKQRKEAKTEIEKLDREHTFLKNDRSKIIADESLAIKSQEQVEKMKSRLTDVKDDINIQGKSINRRILPLIERSEKEATDLMLKREALEKEKIAIHEFIHELDDKKGRALSKTWQIVNSNFGNIFRSLLPNVDAKLAPPANLSALEGLELKVQLGSVWKESLTELSGGQKSLLALSLVLALLLFKPAPFYILDEVDAALDVSHTRNIGKMIKQHFPHSQFIIVSLKEGMFNNANVLFRVRFENGTSVVSRSVASQAADVESEPPIRSIKNKAPTQEEEDENSVPKKRAGKKN